ncbi:MAG: sporulation protein YabP [Candidatus Merdivicinus sp.]|jgi:sporulation protein YabP
MPDAKSLRMPHSLILEERKRLHVSGVQDVDCFDEGTVILYTNMGRLVIRGRELHVNALDVDTGEFSMEGDLISFAYAEEEKPRYGIFSKLFR